MGVSIPSEVGRGRAPNAARLCDGDSASGFQSPRRWGGGLGRSDNTSTASPGGIVSIPSEVGRGSGSQSRSAVVPLGRRLLKFQSPRKVGRGRALVDDDTMPKLAKILFQSPRRWVGVGLFMSRPSMTPRSIALFRFNPLGGEAAWGSHQRLVSIFGGIRKVISFQSPRKWGRVGLASTTFNTSRIISPSFNPLGGGAGSGSQHMQKAMEQISASGFQSPRRWGGVGLVHLASPAQRLLA